MIKQIEFLELKTKEKEMQIKITNSIINENNYINKKLKK